MNELLFSKATHKPSVLMNNRDLIGSNNFHQDVRKAWKQLIKFTIARP